MQVSRTLGERRPAPCAATSDDPRYQGNPFKSGACADCSGNPPAICINVMTSTPEHPPPINAANTHQNETIGSPPFLPWVYARAGVHARDCWDSLLYQRLRVGIDGQRVARYVCAQLRGEKHDRMRNVV